MHSLRHTLLLVVKVLLLIGAMLLLMGCDLPRDPGGTLQRVSGGVLRAGAAENPPWIIAAEGSVRGSEADLVRAIARDRGARVVWVRGTESELLERLERRELDLVAGGLTDDNPWRARVAFAGPYATTRGESGPERHVLALPPGENGWLVLVERFMHERERAGRARTGGAP